MRTLQRASFFSAILGLSILLLIGPVGAAPSLSLSPQSNAQYQLLASYRTVQSCTASPANYTFIGCGPGPNPSLSQPVVVNVTDDRTCSAGDSNCKFVPASVTINVGGTIEWNDVGKLNHTISFANGQISGFSLFVIRNATSSFFFESPYSYRTFEIAGNYSYYDNSYNWMKGNVDVKPLPPPAPIVHETNATGSIGWTLVGLDQRADLSFNHALTITSNSTGSTRSSTNESGIFEDTINLTTREETPGLASQFGYLPNIFPTQWLTLSGPGFPSNYYPPSNCYYPSQDVYTIWWVNGPLENGSTVQLLTSVASVRGNESFSLPAGNFQAWTIASKFVESYNQTQPTSSSNSLGVGQFPIGSSPYPLYYTAGASSTVSISLDYGQKSDLLFGANAFFRNYNEEVTAYPNGSYINPYGYYPYRYYSYPIRVAQNVNITNTYETVALLSLTLKNTNLNLSQRMTLPATNSGSSTGSSGGSNPTPGDGPQNTANAPSSMLGWEYLTIGTIAVAGVGASVWTGLRLRKRASNTVRPSEHQQTLSKWS